MSWRDVQRIAFVNGLELLNVLTFVEVLLEGALSAEHGG